MCVCVHACVFASVLNSESCCEQLGRHCYTTCSHTDTEYRQHFDDITHTLLMPGIVEHILLDLAHICFMVTLCVFFSPFTHKTHTFWSLHHDATASQFAPTPARLCLHEHVFEKFKVRLCRLNISSNSVFMCVVLAPPHNFTLVSPCAKKLQLWRQKKALYAL